MTYETIVTSTQGPDSRQVGIVTLNRPKQLNALNNQLMDELGVTTRLQLGAALVRSEGLRGDY